METVEQSLANIRWLRSSLALDTLVSGVVTLLVCYVAMRIIKAGLTKALKKAPHLDARMQELIVKAVSAALWVLTIIIVAGAFGINSASLVALMSVVGVALSLSVQGLLGNLFSGILLMINRPFKLGDFVEIDNKVGTVKSIGISYTTICTPENIDIIVPNGELTNAAVKNYSREPNRRVDVSFSASYDNSAAEVRAALQDAFAMDSRILADPAPFVGVVAYKDSVIDYVARVWCENANYWGVYFTLSENIAACFAKHGVKMSYPHINVHMDK